MGSFVCKSVFPGELCLTEFTIQSLWVISSIVLRDSEVKGHRGQNSGGRLEVHGLVTRG